MTDTQDDISLMTYEQKVTRLDEILTWLDNSATPTDKLAEDVMIGARLIKELDSKLKQVETAAFGIYDGRPMITELAGDPKLSPILGSHRS